MAKRLSPSGKGMPVKKQLFKGGAEKRKNAPKSNRKRKNVTLTVDALFLSFMKDKDWETALKEKKKNAGDFVYVIQDNSFKNGYWHTAKFYYKELFIGNLFFEQKTKSIHQANNYLMFRVAKERFYSKENWVELVNSLFTELGIESYKIKRVDIALDNEEDLVKRFEKLYVKRRSTVLGKSKQPSLKNDPSNQFLASIRYSIDEGKKVITFYKKNFGGLQLSQQESRLTEKKSKSVEAYQVEYWKLNGLKNMDSISRLELRLNGKYAKGLTIDLLQDKAVLLKELKQGTGDNLVFRKGNKDTALVDFSRLSINAMEIQLSEKFEFKITAEYKKLMMDCYQAPYVRLIETLSHDSAYFDIGQDLRILIFRNPVVELRAKHPFSHDALFTTAELQLVRFDKYISAEEAEFREFLKNLDPKLFDPPKEEPLN